MTTKETKTAAELEEMISRRINIGGLFARVHPDPAYGWHAVVITAPTQVVAAQQAVDEIVQELRGLYDLKA